MTKQEIASKWYEGLMNLESDLNNGIAEEIKRLKGDQSEAFFYLRGKVPNAVEHSIELEYLSIDEYGVFVQLDSEAHSPDQCSSPTLIFSLEVGQRIDLYEILVGLSSYDALRLSSDEEFDVRQRFAAIEAKELYHQYQQANHPF